MSAGPFTELRIYPADERFVELGTHAERSGENYLSVGYRCPDGPPGLSFTWRGLAELKGWGSHLEAAEVAVLEPSVSAILHDPGHGPFGKRAADFRCPQCNRPIVVVFRDTEMEKDWWGYEPIIVLELDPS
jgi:hypothetical protein